MKKVLPFQREHDHGDDGDVGNKFTKDGSQFAIEITQWPGIEIENHPHFQRDN